MISKISRKLADMHLKTKLAMLVVGTMLIILTVNSIMYIILNGMTQQLDDIYIGNVRLNELEDALDRVENSMAGYLNTKGTDTLDEYYRAKQTYEDLLKGLEKEITDNQLKMMERDIYNMSFNYLKVTDGTIEAKRGRNVERYKEMYDSAGKLYSYIKTYITSLNGYRFRGNTESYRALSSSLGYLEFSSIISIIIMVFFDIMLVILVTGNITKPLNDLAIAAEIMKGHKVHKDVRCIVIPGSQQVYMEALEAGYLKTFIESGAAVSTPTCGPCMGGHMGIMTAGERCVSTTNRNFRGRMGHVDSEVYLAGPHVAAASAILGRIATPEEVE